MSGGRYGTTRILTISLPETVAEEIERRRGYDSRSRYILRIVDRYHRELDNNKMSLVGATVSSHKHQPEPNSGGTEFNVQYKQQ
jgi:hypothetical protein